VPRYHLVASDWRPQLIFRPCLVSYSPVIGGSRPRGHQRVRLRLACNLAQHRATRSHGRVGCRPHALSQCGLTGACAPEDTHTRNPPFASQRRLHHTQAHTPWPTYGKGQKANLSKGFWPTKRTRLGPRLCRRSARFHVPPPLARLLSSTFDHRPNPALPLKCTQLKHARPGTLPSLLGHPFAAGAQDRASSRHWRFALLVASQTPKSRLFLCTSEAPAPRLIDHPRPSLAKEAQDRASSASH
jgi:hypothetical protein